MNDQAQTRLTAAEVVRRVLQKHGVDAVFALAGASQSRLLDECERSGMRVISTRHETATVGAADGYARLHGGIGVACINVDQGMPNAVTGILSAFEDCIPVVVLVGREPDTWTEPELPVDHDALALVRPITKWARTVHAAERLGEYVDAACRRARSGRPGPVVVSYPKDFLAADVETSVRLEHGDDTAVVSAPTTVQVARAASLIRAAHRPIIIAGSGAYMAGAGAALRDLSINHGIPVLTNAMGRGLVIEDARLGFPWPLAQTVVHDADLVVWTGARMAKRFGYGLAPRFSPTARMIQIDIAAEELGRNRPLDVAMAADARLALEMIGAEIKRSGGYSGDPGWLAAALAPRIAAVENSKLKTAVGIHPYAIGRAVMALAPKDAIIVNDGAMILGRMFAVLRIQPPQTYVDTYPLGSMGMGTPMALGAAAAAQKQKSRRVILITGDGSFGFYAAEINSMVQAGLDISVIVANNGGWGNELATQPFEIGRTLNATFTDVDHGAVARGLGAHGIRVQTDADLHTALADALARPGVSVIDAIVGEPEPDRDQATIIYSDVERTRTRHFGGKVSQPS